MRTWAPNAIVIEAGDGGAQTGAVVAAASLQPGETRTGTNAVVSRSDANCRRQRYRRLASTPSLARDLGHNRARLVHRRDKPSLLRRAPAPTTLDRRDDLDTIHRHVANLVLATGPTPVPSTHKAAPVGRVRSIEANASRRRRTKPFKGRAADSTKSSLRGLALLRRLAPTCRRFRSPARARRAKRASGRYTAGRVRG